MRGVRPDYSDAGYGQAGCMLIVFSAVGGWIVGLVGSRLLGDVLQIAPVGLAAEEHVTVVAGSMAVSLVAAVASMWVIERSPRLWRWSDQVLMAIWLAPGPIVALVLAARLEILVDPLAWAVAAALGFAAIDLARGRLRARLRRIARPRAGRNGIGRASLFGGLLGNVAATGWVLLSQPEWIVPEADEGVVAAANFAVGSGLALAAGFVAGLVQGRVMARPLGRQPGESRQEHDLPRSTLIVAAATSGFILWWLASQR